MSSHKKRAEGGRKGDRRGPLDERVDPRRVFAPGRGRSAPKSDRKVKQLCGQVRRTVEQVLLGELDDDVLRCLYVLDVEPAPDESRLLVTVGPFTSDVAVDPVQVIARLGAASGRIRAEVAAAITRRKTPNLIYQFAQT